MSARKQKRERPEPAYVITNRQDGTKSVDVNEFAKDPRVIAQIRKLADMARRGRE